VDEAERDEQALERLIGRRGSPERAEFERRVAELAAANEPFSFGAALARHADAARHNLRDDEFLLRCSCGDTHFISIYHDSEEDYYELAFSEAPRTPLARRLRQAWAALRGRAVPSGEWVALAPGDIARWLGWLGGAEIPKLPVRASAELILADAEGRDTVLVVDFDAAFSFWEICAARRRPGVFGRVRVALAALSDRRADPRVALDAGQRIVLGAELAAQIEAAEAS
jgi:hypothetical protein